jgi:hypothetical protein
MITTGIAVVITAKGIPINGEVVMRVATRNPANELPK